MSNVININNTQVEFKTENKSVFTDSKTIAEVFGKRHDNVLRIIENKKSLFGPLNFEESSYINSQNKSQRMYLVDRDFFTFIVMGFTGITADHWKIQYIKAFNEMEKRLTEEKQLTRKELAYMVIEAEEAKEKALLAQKAAEEKVAILTHANHLYRATEIAKELGMKSAIALNNKLRDDKIQYKTNGTWVLYAKYSSMGLTSIKQHQLENGKIIYDRRWTGLGREFLLEKYGKDK